ncbi:MAG: hypothetical protein NXI17_03750 [Alphaproteobacteria bacterium]|nr:hypothetical protein [Alphaproteobacteria bacterium]
MNLRDLDTPCGHVKDTIAEHDLVDVSKAHKRPSVGDKVRVFPNHACPASNLFDTVFPIHGQLLTDTLKLAVRGKFD